MAKKIILISGKARHGKDTLANYIHLRLEAENKKSLILCFGDRLKDILKRYYGWNGKKDEYGRTLLQVVGQKIRAKDPMYFVREIEELIYMLSDEFDYFIIPDTRFRNETRLVITGDDEDDFDIKTLRVNRTDFDNGLTEEQKGDISETQLDNYNFDYVVNNDKDLALFYDNIDSIYYEITK